MNANFYRTFLYVPLVHFQFFDAAELCSPLDLNCTGYLVSRLADGQRQYSFTAEIKIKIKTLQSGEEAKFLRCGIRFYCYKIFKVF